MSSDDINPHVGMKRRHSTLSGEKTVRLIQQACSGNKDISMLALEHLALLTNDPESAHALASNRNLTDVLMRCSMAFTDGGDARADMFALLVNMLSVPKAQVQLWGIFCEHVACPERAKWILDNEDAQSLAMYFVRSLETPEADVKPLEFLTKLLSNEQLEEEDRIKAFTLFMPESSSNLSLLATKHPHASSPLLRLLAMEPYAHKVKNRLRQAESAAFEWIRTLTAELFQPSGMIADTAMALGNLLGVLSTRKVVMRNAELYSHLLSTCALQLTRVEPSREANMIIWIIFRLTVCPEGFGYFATHHQASHVVTGVLKCLSGATATDHECLTFVAKCLSNDLLKQIVLAGGNLKSILRNMRCLMSSLGVECSALLLAIVEATDASSVLVASDDGPQLIAALCRIKEGRACLHSRACLHELMPVVQWSPELVLALTLDYKQEWISKQLRQGLDKARPATLHLVIHRDNLLDGLCNQLDRPLAELQQGIDVRFGGDGESGSGNGHRREFFKLAAAEITDPSFGLFKTNDDCRSFHLSSTAAESQPDYIAQFELCGKLVGLALLHRETLPNMRFTPALRKLLLGNSPTTMEDMAAVDPCFYDGKICYLRESRYREGSTPMTIEDLDLSFEDIPQPDVFPDVRHELCPKGSQIKVTEENKHSYLWLLCEYRLCGSVRPHLEALRKGFGSVVPESVRSQIQRVINPSEFGLILCGVMELDVAEWKQHSVRHEGTSTETWNRFWRVVEAFGHEQRNELLEFVTGSPTLPVGGFPALPGYGGPGSFAPFTLAPSPRGENARLPTAATCFNKLYMPTFSDDSAMRSALLEAVAHRGAGFYEGAVAQ